MKVYESCWSLTTLKPLGTAGGWRGGALGGAERVSEPGAARAAPHRTPHHQQHASASHPWQPALLVQHGQEPKAALDQLQHLLVVLKGNLSPVYALLDVLSL